MKKKLSLILMAMGLVTFISCGKADDKSSQKEATQSSGKEVTENAKAETASKTTSSVNKTYNGTIPCADCAGIDVTLVLNQNGSYIMQYIYDTNEGDVTSISNGFWKEKGDKILLSNTDGEITYISQSSNEEAVTFLDQKGNPIETSLNYTLTAVTPDQKIGEYTYLADAPIFVESSSNRQYFAPGEELEVAYLATAIEAGTPVYVEVIGYYSLAPSMEEAQFTPVLIQTGTINFEQK